MTANIRRPKTWEAYCDECDWTARPWTDRKDAEMDSDEHNMDHHWEGY